MIIATRQLLYCSSKDPPDQVLLLLRSTARYEQLNKFAKLTQSPSCGVDRCARVRHTYLRIAPRNVYGRNWLSMASEWRMHTYEQQLSPHAALCKHKSGLPQRHTCASSTTIRHGQGPKANYFSWWWLSDLAATYGTEETANQPTDQPNRVFLKSFCEARQSVPGGIERVA